MSEHDRNGTDDLRASLTALSERVTDVFLRAEAMRALLIERGVFSQAEFDRQFQQRQKLWSARIYFHTGKREDNKLAQLLHLLESLDVTRR